MADAEAGQTTSSARRSSATVSAVAILLGKSDRAYCTDMLPKVSRTFALAIRLLPSELEHTVLIAYLLCRVADTIEDSTSLPNDRKIQLLKQFRRCLEANGPDATPLAQAFEFPKNDEEELAKNADVVLREFRRTSDEEQAAVRPWVQEMCDGMADFTARSSTQSGERVHLLGTVDELENYCYYVAGTVGHLLTDLFNVSSLEITPEHYQSLKPLATSFGLGLQLTNIIKDVADDRDRGWSFVPKELFDNANIPPEELHHPERRSEARKMMQVLIDKAQRHLDDALLYCTRLPRSQYRMRMFCLTSLYFAVRTLRLATSDPKLLEPGYKVKISRPEVYRTVAATAVVAPSNTLVNGYFKFLVG
ncbi:MAG: phytoene/squalene synthase family protein [Gemmatimonadota bacterium]|nr:phytoene/squalene synthase family protein [Gemmatimonadota bacterium]